MYSGFSESGQMDWIVRSGAIAVPHGAARCVPRRGDETSIPFALTSRAKAYIQRILAADAPEADRIVLITSDPLMTYDVWLTAQTSLFGFTERHVGDFGSVRVLLFEREQTSP